MTTKRLDEQFPIKATDLIWQEMRRLLPVLEARFGALEKQQADYQAVIENVRQTAIDRINEILGEAVSRVGDLTTVGAFFTARSTSQIEVGLGERRVALSPETRGNFATPEYIAIINAVDPRTSVAGILKSYDPDSGLLILDAHQATYGDSSDPDWIICAAAPPMLPSVVDGGFYDEAPTTELVIPYVTDLFGGGTETGAAPVSDIDGGVY